MSWNSSLFPGVCAERGRVLLSNLGKQYTSLGTGGTYWNNHLKTPK